MTDDGLPTGDNIPKGTLAFPTEDGVVFVRRCDICFAAVIETHDADFQEHVEWHERTGTNKPPTD
jgi:hypothetical protein